MMNIKGAGEAMAGDMHDAAMKLGAAGMMLASASNAVHKHAARLTQHGRNRSERPLRRRACRMRPSPRAAAGIPGAKERS